MGRMSISIDTKKLKKELDKIEKDAETVTKRTVADFKTRAPAWISKAVTAEYNIKKAEVKDSLKGKKKIGTIKLSGTKVDDIALVYKGRLLTPIHFGMKPTRHKARSKAKKNKMLIPGENVEGYDGEVAQVAGVTPYQITMEVHKGKRKALPSDVFLGSNKGAGEIPFQRTGNGRTPIQSIKSTSVPQMITNEKVSEEISKAINEGMEERLKHHLSRMQK